MKWAGERPERNIDNRNIYATAGAMYTSKSGMNISGVSSFSYNSVNESGGESALEICSGACLGQHIWRKVTAFNI